MTESIQQKATRYRELKSALDEGYRNLKELEYEIIADMRAEYPDEWRQWERGVSSLTAEGVEIPVSRTYDTDKLTAEFGEEYPDLVKEETKVVMKANGRKLAGMWKDAAIARRLENCVVTPTPKVKVK